MIVEPPELPAARVAETVRRAWGLDIASATHVEAGTGAWHWTLEDTQGPRWFATADAVDTPDERRDLFAAYESAAALARELPFVIAPAHARDGRVAVDAAPGFVLTVAPHLEGLAGTGPFADDVERTPVASMLGEVHRRPRPRHLPVWRPRVGRHARAQRADLERCLGEDIWQGGPWSHPARRMLTDASPVVKRSLKRFALLGAAVSGTVERWVVTHGEPRTSKVLATPDGLRMVGWAGVALAPRERDLRAVLGEAEGNEPWYAYIEAGGRTEPLSADTVEMFALEWHLSEIADHVVRFAGPHEDTPDARRCFGDLEHELAALLERWR